jgi:DUF4097 and DUF4098 domain-containing protein YvlB
MRTAIFVGEFLIGAALGSGLWAAPAVAAENSTQTCEARQWHDDHLRTIAEPRQQTMAQASLDRIEASPNGSIVVHGTSRSDVQISACIHASAPSEDEARQIASEVRIARGPGEIVPDGPREEHDRHWSVSYEVWLPSQSSLHVNTVNGSIKIEQVQGEIKVSNVNGGLNLAGLGGEVRASTVNGGITIDLAGMKWDGSGLQISTVNGGIRFNVPSNYAANVEASTVNGGVHCDFPISLQGSIGKHVSFQLGGGGPEIRTSTVNGGIRFSRGA